MTETLNLAPALELLPADVAAAVAAIAGIAAVVAALVAVFSVIFPWTRKT